MKILSTIKIIAACAITAGAVPAFAHIVLEGKSAPASSSYKAVFLVGHGCQGSATTGVAVQIPTGFLGAKPYPKAGWTVSTQLGKLARPYDSHGKRVTDDVTLVSWTANGKESALPDAFFDEFVLRGKLPDSAGPLWFKVRQTCESGSNDWSDIPASGTSTAGLKAPAALLEVTADAPSAVLTAPGQPVQVSDAWVRATVPGQKGSGAFMTLTSKTATRLVGVSSPVAGVAEVHEMKMDGDVMRMRQIPGLDLPAGTTVALTSGGYHLMLMDLKQTLTSGSTVPVTLLFKDGKGVTSRLELKLPVATSAPGGGKAAPADHGAHKH
jgi:hypothetical protein